MYQANVRLTSPVQLQSTHIQDLYTSKVQIKIRTVFLSCMPFFYNQDKTVVSVSCMHMCAVCVEREPGAQAFHWFGMHCLYFYYERQ